MSQVTALVQVAGRATRAPAPLQPLPLRLSAILFGILALAMAASIYLFMPWLASLGIPDYKCFLAAHIVPMALLFGAALVGLYRIERYPVTWGSLAERFRFPRLRFKDVLWALAIYVALMLGYGVTSQFGAALVAGGVMPIPAGLSTWMDPRIPMVQQVAGGAFRGNPEIVLLWFVMLFFNIAGEELWWRGYLLPRQELAHGRWTWLVHGLQWTLFHLFKWWDVLGLLPVCLIIAFAAQRLKNNWPVFIAHYIFNGMALVIVAAAALGLMP
jgi:membrane protease YdiL (CAAX protease family)